jgi:hypothetical protein
VAATAAAAGAAAAATTANTPARPAAPGAGNASPAASAAAAAAAAAVAALSNQKPFAEVIKGAKETPGFYNIYERDDKVWIEIKPEQFDQPFFFAFNLSSGLGEKWFFGGLMVDSFVASFHRLSATQVQLIARNTEYFAKPDTRSSPSGGVLRPPSAAPVAASRIEQVDPHQPMPRCSRTSRARTALERAYQNPTVRPEIVITKARATSDLVTINVNAHYALQRVSQPAPGAGFTNSPPSTVLTFAALLGFYYNIAKLPSSRCVRASPMTVSATSSTNARLRQRHHARPRST